MTYAKSALGGGIVALIFGQSLLGSAGFLLALISGIAALVKNKEKDRNVRAYAIFAIVLAILGSAIRTIMGYGQ